MGADMGANVMVDMTVMYLKGHLDQERGGVGGGGWGGGQGRGGWGTLS